VTVTIQLVGSVPLVGHTFAYNVVPTTLKRSVYDVLPVAANGDVARIVVEPPTFFCTTRLVPSIYAFYQLLPSVQRSTAPRLVLLKTLSEPLKSTSALVALGPRTAL
jgi:hypothetical protein